MKVAERIAKTEVYYFARKLAEIRRMNAEGLDVINLGIGSPDLAPPDQISGSLVANMESDAAFTYQSYRGLPELREAWVRHMKHTYGLGISSEQEVFPTMGSKEALGFVALSYLESGRAALVPNPGYPAYKALTELAGAKAIPFGLDGGNDWHPDVAELEKLRRESSEDVSLIWLNYPNMPTGQAPDPVRLQAVVDWAAARDVLIVHDNPYSLVLAGENPFSMLQLDGSKEQVIELQSLSKSHHMAGARIGFVMGSASLIDPVFRTCSNFSSGSWRPMQHAAIAALSAPDSWRQEQDEIYRSRRDRAHEILSHLGCSVSGKSQGLFVWGEVPGGQSGEALSEQILQKAQVFITPGGIFGSAGEGYLRISLCSPEEQFSASLHRIQTRLN